MALNLITFASEAEAHSSVPNPWVIGGLVLLLLLGLLPASSPSAAAVTTPEVPGVTCSLR